MNLNNKGFTLVEVLTVMVLITILGVIAVPNVLDTINNSKDKSYQIQVKNIVTASESLYEELEYTQSEIYYYDLNGKTDEPLKITDNTITINLQTLISNGFLKGSNNPDNSDENKNKERIINVKNNIDIGDCQISITKIVEIENNYKVSYIIENNSSDNKNCPTSKQYSKGV